MRKASFEFLKELLSTPSPSGFESAGQKLWCKYARACGAEVHTDSYGNAVASLNPAGDPKIMLDGHADEIGLMVKHIDEDGFVYFQRLGGVNLGLIRSKRVDIHTNRGVVRGVVGATPIHLEERGKAPKVPKLHEMFIDIGAADARTASRRVHVGDPITFVDDFEMLNKNVAVARAFDNRAGTWMVIESLRLATAGGAAPKCAIYACSSIQEEVGLYGAMMNVFNIKPDMAIVAEVTHATDTPGIDVKQYGQVKMNKGPSVGVGRENHPAVVERIRKVARRKNIPLQTEAFSQAGGTNALAIFSKQGGIPSAVLSVPNRYMHSTVEMIDLRDLERAARLLAAFCMDLKAGERFRVKV